MTTTGQDLAAAGEMVLRGPFLPNSGNDPNPRIVSRWSGSYGVGWPVVNSDDLVVFDAMLLASAT
jgi:hypothetical protein